MVHLKNECQYKFQILVVTARNYINFNFFIQCFLVLIKKLLSNFQTNYRDGKHLYNNITYTTQINIRKKVITSVSEKQNTDLFTFLQIFDLYKEMRKHRHLIVYLMHYLYFTFLSILFLKYILWFWFDKNENLNKTFFWCTQASFLIN